MNYRNKTFLILLVPGLLLAGCSTSRYSQRHDSAPVRDIDVSQVPDAVPRNEPLSKYGNPDSYTVYGRRYTVLNSADGYSERGIASWYGKKFHGHRTSSGEPYDMYAMSAAHKTLPLPSYVRVTNLKNRKSVIVRVNDRGPFHQNRLIDLSYVAAKKLGIIDTGTGMVEVTVLRPGAMPSQVPRTASEESATEAEMQLYLQVGAFVSRHNAEQLRDKLHRQFTRLTIQSAYNANEKLYRVRIGPLASVDEADELAMTLTRKGFTPPHIVID
ncbi:MAG: septal ring lytic transglycosylase RlpA family protein [Proteobacteria bacterium]|jgi:rare lipoprotein A|nr:septal ring lytic transglycosylase RlpA family protein [Pseudomonadota bacterium]